MSDEANELLNKVLRALQKRREVRMGIAAAAALALLAVGAWFLYDALPHNYQLSISGGEMLSGRHFVARVLQREAADNGVALRIIPMPGTREELAAVNEGRLDMAFIQDGMGNDYPNIRHVAYIASEPLQLLVRPGITEIAGLRNKLVNLGTRLGGTREIAKEVLLFSGLNDGVDYVESNFSTEDLLRMAPDALPDAVMVISFAPADVADLLVKQRGYSLLEIPYPDSLALRYGWVANSKILAYTYSVAPPVPARDIKTIGINMHLVANKDVEPRAVFRVLESLYGPSVEMATKIKLSEEALETSSGYELSDGSKLFLERKNPLLTADTLDQVKAMFGVFLSALSMILVAYRWLKGEAHEEPSADDPVFIAWLNDVVAIEQQYETAARPMSQHLVDELQARLSKIKAASLGRLESARLDNAQLPQALLLAISDTRARIARDHG